MARIRTIKPEFFRHEGLYELEKYTGLPIRVAFAGLWTVVDREGRFAWKPRAIKLDCLPYDECNFEDILNALTSKGFVIKYKYEDGKEYGYIPSWLDHQVINTREAQSTIPEPSIELHVQAHANTDTFVHIPRGVNIPKPLRETVIARDGNKCLRCGEITDLTIDHIFPQSIGGTHAITNLRCLCRKCNSARPVAGIGLIEDLAKDGLSMDDMQRMCMHVQVKVEGKGKERNGKEEERKGRSDSSTFVLPDWIDKTHWDIWVKSRKKMNDDQKQMQVAKLKAWKDEGLDFAGALANAAANGTQGLFLPQSNVKRTIPKQDNFDTKDYGQGVTSL